MKHLLEAASLLLSEIDLKKPKNNFYFVDASAFVALTLVDDQFHQRAMQIRLLLDKELRKPLTIDYVLTEVYGFLSARGGWRIANSFDQGIQNSDLEIIYQGQEGFKKARESLLKYKDKDYSLTDCASFNTMQTFGITDVFTFDRHFKQAGFKIIE